MTMIENHDKDYHIVTHEWGTEYIEFSALYLDLVISGGTHYAFNTMALGKASFEPMGDTNTIILEFPEERVVIKGYLLESIYQKILSREIAVLKEQGDRYASLNEKSKPYISSIVIEKLEI